MQKTKTFEAIVERFKEQNAYYEGKLIIPRDRHLKNWLQSQRKLFLSASLPQDKKRILDTEIPGWDQRLISINEVAFLRNVEKMRLEIMNNNGKISTKNPVYGSFLTRQRRKNKEEKLSTERKKLLDFSVPDWEGKKTLYDDKHFLNMLERVAAVVDARGGKPPKAKTRESEWLIRARQRKSKLSLERKQALDEKIPHWENLLQRSKTK